MLKDQAELNLSDVDDHFSSIASKYQSVRTLDREPIIYIKNRIGKKCKVTLADVGCGDGRYSLEFLKSFDESFYIHCIDYNENMLKHLGSYLTAQSISNFCVQQGDASSLPLDNDSMNYIVTFNAIHHFDVPRFLDESLRSLKDGGRLFIYTRLRNQNSRNIWGLHFPLFTEFEKRLFELDELEHYIQDAGMRIHSSKVFRYNRISNLNRLVEQAESNHYSTFALYNKELFHKSLQTFQQNIKHNFGDLNKVRWFDENILLEVIK